MRLVFKKGNGVKFIEEGSKLIPIIKADGWKEDKLEPEKEKTEVKKEKSNKKGKNDE